MLAWFKDVARRVGNLGVRLKGLEVLQEICSDHRGIGTVVLQASIVNMKRGEIYNLGGLCDYHEHADGAKGREGSKT